MRKDIYGPITIVAMLTMPMAAAINFGDAAYDALLGRVSAAWIATAGGIATGIGFEAIGILAGHLAVSFYSRKDGRALAAVAALVAYVIIGMYELWSIPMARFVPLLAGLVYLLAGLQHEDVEEKERETAVSATRLDFQLEQARLDREAERERQASNDQRQHEENLRRLEVETQAQIEQAALSLEEKRMQAEERQRKREARRAQAEGKREQAALDSMATEEKVLAIYSKDPKASQQSVANQTDVSRQRIGQILQDLEGRGAISRNGKGVVIKE
jgi:flagellar biosynthesis GTPase FlhF